MYMHTKLRFAREALAAEPLMSAAELRKKAKAQGIKMTLGLCRNYVSAVRAELRKAKPMPPYPSTELNETDYDDAKAGPNNILLTDIEKVKELCKRIGADQFSRLVAVLA